AEGVGEGSVETEEGRVRDEGGDGLSLQAGAGELRLPGGGEGLHGDQLRVFGIRHRWDSTLRMLHGPKPDFGVLPSEALTSPALLSQGERREKENQECFFFVPLSPLGERG